MSKQKFVGDDLASSISNVDSRILNTAFLVDANAGSGLHSLNFMDGSISYFGTSIKQGFNYILIDNIGIGIIRIAINRTGLDLSSSITGAKTLSAKDSLYIQDVITSIDIYYESASTVELVLINQ